MNDDRLAKSDFLRLGILAGVSLLLGVYLILTTPVIARDGVFYIEQARKLFDDPLGVARRYPPGYPFLLRVAYQAARLVTDHDSALLWAYGSQGVTLLCRTLALVPLYFLGKLLVGARNSFWALVILLLLPHPAHYGSDVLREWPYVLFLSLGFGLLYRGLTGEWRIDDCGLQIQESHKNHQSSIINHQSTMFGLAGLAAGLGYLIRPECQQLVIYGVLGLFQLGLADRRLGIRDQRQAARDWRRFGAGLAMIAAFAVPAGAYMQVMGTIVPHQLRPSTANTPPVIVSVGTKTADNGLLEYEAGEGQMLELPIEAFDPQNDQLTFSFVGVPVGSRPVYQLRSATMGTRFWTISNDEKEFLLATYSRQVWDCDGIAWYAYPEPGARPGLQPVYRFWSPVEGRHFYTSSESERDALLQESSDGSWHYETVAFYAFGEAARPPDAVPVYRFHSRQHGYSWVIQDPKQAGSIPEGDVSLDAIAWYVQTAGEPPAGAELDGRTFRWRPGRPGEYQVNIIVSDGKLQSCQPVKIRVRGQTSSFRLEAEGGRAETIKDCGLRIVDCGLEKTPGANPKSEIRNPKSALAGVGKLPRAVHVLFDALDEDLAVVFLVPWLLGLYYRLRYEAGQTERVLVMALVFINVGLMLARYAWVAPGSSRRYGLGLVALTIFYVPVGVEVMARWLNGIMGDRPQHSNIPVFPHSHIPSGSGLCFHALVAAGAVVCLTWLFLPPQVDERAYRIMARWLQENTEPEDALAVPDPRISFYAERPGLYFARYPDPRKADYVVRIESEGPAQTPENWQQKYSVPLDNRGPGRSLVAYRIVRAKP